MTIKTRFKRAKSEWEEERWITEMQGGLQYLVHGYEMSFFEDPSRPKQCIQPTRIGVWMLVLWDEFKWQLALARYVVTGKEPKWFAWED